MRIGDLSGSVFADSLISATELNRQPGHILDMARVRPVTITRNDDYFALLRREQAAELFGMAGRVKTAVGICRACGAVLRGESVEDGDPMAWVGDLDDPGDPGDLITEVLDLLERCLEGAVPWTEFDTMLHEWEETASVARHGLLSAALKEPAAPVPLQSPRR